MGKIHGSLAQAGKVRNNTPKVDKKEKEKPVRGRAHIRKLYNKRFLTTNPEAKKKVGPNSQSQQNNSSLINKKSKTVIRFFLSLFQKKNKKLYHI